MYLIERETPIITSSVREKLISNFNKVEENPLVIARWAALDGVEYFGIEISPDRPTVVWGFVELPQDMGGNLEFSTFWVEPELDNPYSKGQSLEEQTVVIRINGMPVSVPMWSLDTSWCPVSLKALKKKRGW